MISQQPMKHFFWIDLEMTGLDEKKDSILEIAVVITDLDFKPVHEFHRIVYQPPEILENMNDWCKKTHGDSGLTAAVALGTPLAQVEIDLVELLNRYFSTKDRVPLAGNSVGNDKRFIDFYMPKLSSRLHYRLIDVSSFKEIFREKYGLSVEKKNGHRALDDIYESIRELQYFLSFIHIPPPQESLL